MEPWLTENALIICDHGGKVGLKPTQDYVRITDLLVLIEPNPFDRGISACPNTNPTIGIRPCKTTLKVEEGYSDFITISDHAVSLNTVEGHTDGSPPGTVHYKVANPGQTLVQASE
jgi:hypothetical protein